MSHRSSGNLQADRRYSYARDYLKDGDFAAAADLFGQALELAPNWAPALMGLGEALEKSGEIPSAIMTYHQARAAEPSDELGAGLRLARLGAVKAQDAMTAEYVAALFDEYAPRFDAHLTEMLAYRGPEIILEALRAVCQAKGRAFQFHSGLDLGCGTGLMAKALGCHVEALDGVDLAPAMVAIAQKTGRYREVWVGDVVEALDGKEHDLLLAADVLVYLGDLANLFQAAAKAMQPQAIFAFTVQLHPGDGFGLGADLRYHHSLTYVTATAHAAGLQVLHSATCVTREDAGQPVPGLVFVLERSS